MLRGDAPDAQLDSPSERSDTAGDTVGNGDSVKVDDGVGGALC